MTPFLSVLRPFETRNQGRRQEGEYFSAGVQITAFSAPPIAVYNDRVDRRRVDSDL